MIRKTRGNLQWLEFELLQEEKLQHAIFLRQGGYSEGNFASLNLAISVGDDLKAVTKNRKQVMDMFCCEELIIGRQVHGDQIERVGENFASARDSDGLFCDGLLTEAKEKALTILHADCQAAIFYDPVHHRVANIHCGWRGNVQNIYQKTIEKMKAMGSNPADLLVGVSPSLGPNKAEFIQFEKEFPKEFHEFRIKDCLFDLWKISYMQLTQSGILPTHIELSEICTHEKVEDYFSYRRDKTTGRNATVVKLL